MIISIIGAIVAFFVVVLIHELGHFVVARLCGVNILKFSIGFGKAFWSYTSQKTGTIYALGIFPLGGYVKMFGERMGEACDPEQLRVSYVHKSVWARMVIALAGPAANMLLAFVVFWIVYMSGVTYQKPIIGYVYPRTIAAKAGLQVGEQIIKVGQQKIYGWHQVVMSLLSHIGEHRPLLVLTYRDGLIHQHQFDLSQWRIAKRDPEILKSLGITPKFAVIPAVISRVLPYAPAAFSGLQKGDRIVAINGKQIRDWMQVSDIVAHKPGQQLVMTVARSGHQRYIKIKLGSINKHHHQNTGYLGIEVAVPPIPESMLETVQYGFFESMIRSADRTRHIFMLNAQILVKMFTGHVSIKTLGGPVSVFHTAGMASQAGFVVYLSFIGFMSIALGFINLLPIPLLDGGHVLFQLVEMIARRPLSQRYQIMAVKFGIVMLLWVMIQATINDMLRLFS